MVGPNPITSMPVNRITAQVGSDVKYPDGYGSHGRRKKGPIQIGDCDIRFFSIGK